MNKKFGALSSSVDPQKLADSVEGVIKVIAGIALSFGLAKISGNLSQTADQIGIIVTLGYSFYGAVQTIFGLARKVIVSIQEAWSAYRQ